MSNPTQLVQPPNRQPLSNAIHVWAAATTGEGNRRADLLRDKQRIVDGFFEFIDLDPAEVTPLDVQAWLEHMAARGIRPATTYQRVCLLSSFYSWAMRDPRLGAHLRSNPARLARPRAPKAYQTESAKSLTDNEVQGLISIIRRRAAAGDIVGKRDHAILLLLIATGMRRAEALSLRGRDLRIEKTLVLTSKVKGGDYLGREVADPAVKEALLDYLASAKRLHVLQSDAPVWTRHDRAGRPGEPLSSHCYVRNLKRYAREAGIEHFHLHQTRHTFARIVAEETGSIAATQDALDHKNQSTTRVYVQRIAIKRDRHSEQIMRRLKGSE